MKPREAGNLLARLLDAAGSNVHLETMAGTTREGKLTGWNCKTIRINGRDLPWPESLELNGDPGDVVALKNIRSIIIDKNPEDSEG